MNRTQREAWFNLAAAVLYIPIIVWALARLFILKRVPEGLERFWPLPVFIIFIVASIVLMRRKQSPAEVESDERDRLIKYRAVVACFVSVWVLLAAATAVPQLIAGVKGSIPVWLLAFINVGVLLIALLVYSAAVLVQYGRGTTGLESGNGERKKS
jgi:Na+/H+ antiporter NhaC